MDPDQPALVSEVVLKRRREHEKSQVALAAATELKRSRRRQEAKDSAFVRPETLLRQAQQREHDLSRARRKLKLVTQKQKTRRRPATSAAKAEVSPALVFAVLVRNSRDAAPRVRKILRRLRLQAVSTGVFLRLDEATEAMLAMVEPYVAFGTPSFATVDDLVRKRGVGRPSLKRRAQVPISDNTVVEKSFLGSLGVICVEDIVAELCAAGEHFQSVTRFLWPFRLTKVGGNIERHLLNEKKHNRGGRVDMDHFVHDAL